MDPITLIVMGVALVSTASAYFLGKRANIPTEVRRKNRQLQVDLKQSRAETEYQEQRCLGYEHDLKLARRQRDEYRKIAETHTIKFPDVPEPVQTHQVWGKRIYRGIPDENLVSLELDFRQFRGRELFLDLKIQGCGGWKKIIKEAGWHRVERVLGTYGSWTNRKVPLDYIGTIHFEGPPNRVLEEIRTFLLDDDTGLTLIPEGSKQKAWKDRDSPLKFVVSLAVSDPIELPEMPDVHMVEVLRVEERVTERVIEKPVVVSIPEGSEPELCGHSKEEIIELIDAVIEMREFPRPKDVEVN